MPTNPKDRKYFTGGKLTTAPPVPKIERKDRKDAEPWRYVAGSSNVKAAKWTEDHGLVIWFDPKDKKGRSTGKESAYSYPSAPRSVFVKLMDHPSKGAFVHEVVIPNYSHVGPSPPGDFG